MQDNEINKLSRIDAAIAEAKARKAAREAQEGSIDKPSTKISAEERAVKKAAILADREARKAAKSANRASKTPRAKPAHMGKVERAEAKLPPLKSNTQQEYNDIIINFSSDQISALALWLQHYNRVKATERSLDAKLAAGDYVQVIGGDPKYLGMRGTVVKAQRIRCYVEIPGFNKPIYLFTSDVEAQVAEASTGTEG